MTLNTQDFKSSESVPKGLENLLNKSSEPDLEPIHARIKADHKQQIETLAETSEFQSQARVIRKALQIALPKLRDVKLLNRLNPHKLEGFERKGEKEAVVDLGSMNGEGIVRFKFIETEDRKPKINAYSYESVKDRERNNFVLYETKMDQIMPIQAAGLQLIEIASEIASKNDLVEKSAEVEEDFSEEVDA